MAWWWEPSLEQQLAEVDRELKALHREIHEVEAASLRRSLKTAQDRLTTVKADRDAWRDLARELAATLTDGGVG